jgi:superfamily II DNA helicase RecQ
MRVSSRQPSPWLARIERAVCATDGTGEPVDARGVIADARGRIGSGGASTRTIPDADVQLFAALVEWRRSLARAAGAPAYVVFNNATLAAIAHARPRTRGALLALPGVGPVKVERYGEAVLELVGQHD